MSRSADSLYYRRRSCTGKQNHRDPIWALVATVMIQRRYGFVFAYKCKFCPNYHVGHVHYLVRECVRVMVDAVDAVMSGTNLSKQIATLWLRNLEAMER